MNKKEKFNETTQSTSTSVPDVSNISDTFKKIIEIYLIYIVFLIITFIIAIYLSLKCKKGFVDFLFAFFLSPIYVLYRIFVGCNNK